MNKLILVLLLSFPQAFSAENGQQKYPIREIRLWLEATDSSETCVDEYLKRRKELGVKIGFSPAIIFGSTLVGVYGGALAGAGVFELSDIPSGGLGNVVALAIGGVVGGTIGLGAGTTEEIISIVNYFKNQSLLRLIYESKNQQGIVIKKFYEEFSSLYPDTTLNKERFVQEISYLDTLGVLCDGSLVKTTRYKKGHKLKQKLATKNEIFNYLAEINL